MILSHRIPTPKEVAMFVSIRHQLFTVILVTVSVSGIKAEDWPWFLGPRHDGTSQETGLNLSWGEGGPPMKWKQSLGTGYSAPSILGDRLVVHSRSGDEEIVSCRRVKDGETIWDQKYASDFADPYGYNNGPRCSPVLAGEHCYTLGAGGLLLCCDITSGDVVWKHDLQKEFDLPDWFFGVGCSPILDNDRLVVLVGGQPNSGVVSFNRFDGTKIWDSVGQSTWDGVVDANSGEKYEWTQSEMVVSYSSPVIAEIHGRRHLLCLVRQGLVSLDPETGKQNFAYWFRPKVHESVNAARPVIVGDQIFLSAAYRLGSCLLKVSPDGKSCEEVWSDPESLLAHWSTPIHVDGFIYGFSGRHENEGELRCIRLSDGKLMWRSTGFAGDLSQFARDRSTGKVVDTKTQKPVPFPYFGRGSLIRVGDRFIALGERGTLAVVEVNSSEFKEHCRHSFDEIHYPAWAAPVLSDGLLYLRSEDWMLSVDLRSQ